MVCMAWFMFALLHSVGVCFGGFMSDDSCVGSHSTIERPPLCLSRCFLSWSGLVLSGIGKKVSFSYLFDVIGQL